MSDRQRVFCLRARSHAEHGNELSPAAMRVFLSTLEMIVPTLRVGMQPGTLCVPTPELERGASPEAFPRGAWERAEPRSVLLTRKTIVLTRSMGTIIVSGVPDIRGASPPVTHPRPA